ncbi:hypothetical protein QE385_002317 [Sphingomonas sp. SORGH_AS 950]|uniref:hypothetical protein n=1 Tax=Sphingomonas sp. SORGH_AS_0950 TaxID=3041792 RepID=UPI00277EBBCE|nr:hypothetical protein [Sphingomonas sp. SORGH_AS_0950]MDQ1157990.1 hypothetical protein [Sphingomonas sp. SORGH_AS_0950]
MPALTPNIENRVRKLPKPSNATQSLQPLFEAVSNAMFGIEDRYGDDVGKGRIDITVSELSNPSAISIVVADDGIGLDADRYAAFCEIDTDFKKSKGGKGVGRLFWLDAFDQIEVDSTYGLAGATAKRAFSFALNNTEQVVPTIQDQVVLPEENRGTRVHFRGIRTKEYADPFPKRADTFLRYFSAHFIADFLMGSGPTILLDVDGDAAEYPKAVSDLVVGTKMETTAVSEEFGELRIVGFICRPEASTGLEGLHQLHLLANGRTVETRKVDNLLGVESLERDGETDLAFHGCVSGDYLDLRVNEGRTAFNLTERTLKQISRLCMDAIRERMLPDQVRKFVEKRRKRYESFVERYPTYGFDDDDTQLGRVPLHATTPEEFASYLVKFQIRRDEERQDTLQRLIDALDSDGRFSFQDSIVEAARGIQASEQLALAQHVVRRKLALELLEKLIARIRVREGTSDDFHLERTLHSFICPMNVRGDDPTRLEGRAHELWIVDERLAFTRAFSSDKRLDDILVSAGSADRPDLFLWDLAHGLGSTDPDQSDAVDLSEPLSSVMVVEFKKPGRRTYSGAKDQIEQQITRYLAQLQGGEIESFGRTRVRIARDCVFHCYVVADIVGDLVLQLSGWDTTSNGQGRIRQLKGDYRGQIEVVQWQDLVNDAWMRNRATLHAAGLSRKRLTPLQTQPSHSEAIEDGEPVD